MFKLFLAELYMLKFFKTFQQISAQKTRFARFLKLNLLKSFEKFEQIFCAKHF